MLISYLGQRNIILPFDGVEFLMMKSDFGIVVAPGTAQEESFKNSKVPLWQKAWAERIMPHYEFYVEYISNCKF